MNDLDAPHGLAAESLAVHAGPLDLSTTYPVPDLAAGVASIDALAAGAREAPNPIYARLHNPTVARFEDALARLEGTGEAVAFASGMAAITAVLLAAKQSGDHLVAVRPLYGTTDHLLSSELLGLDTTWCAADEVAGALRPDTALVLIETPANPTLALVDIADVARQASSAPGGPVPLAVDSTFATPVLQNPLAHGATLAIHSATKYLGGHGDVIAGAVATDAEWAGRLRRVRVATGALLHPLAGYLLHRGLQTLPVRVRAAQAGARELARHLATHPLVERVLFPDLPGADPHGLLGRQMRGPGCMLAFEVAGGFEVAAGVMREVRLMTPAVSLGSVDSLIQHPAGLTHRVVDEGAREASGVGAGLLRISVGLEAPEDLWADLEGALERAAESAGVGLAAAAGSAG